MNIEDIINILGIAVKLLNIIFDVILHTAQSYKSYKKKHRIKVEPFLLGMTVYIVVVSLLSLL